MLQARSLELGLAVNIAMLESRIEAQTAFPLPQAV
jgi:hypothetical protein